jgi:hypothetical protein
MKNLPCPRCGGNSLLHYTDAYVLRTPVINEEGSLKLLYERTNEYDDSFFDCEDCGYRGYQPTETELLPSAGGSDRQYKRQPM